MRDHHRQGGRLAKTGAAWGSLPDNPPFSSLVRAALPSQDADHTPPHLSMGRRSFFHFWKEFRRHQHCCDGQKAQRPNLACGFSPGTSHGGFRPLCRPGTNAGTDSRQLRAANFKASSRLGAGNPARRISICRLATCAQARPWPCQSKDTDYYFHEERRESPRRRVR